MTRTVNFVVAPFYHKNRLFDMNDPVSNRDDCLYPTCPLKTEMERRGFQCGTCDLIPPSAADVVLYFDVPRDLPAEQDRSRSCLLLFENEIILPRNWRLEHHARFHRVFTWHSDLLAKGGNYLPMRYAQRFPEKIEFGPIPTKLACLIASQKGSRLPRELYSARKAAIEWFERHHLEDFEFYGMGWDRPTSSPAGWEDDAFPGEQGSTRSVPGCRGCAPC